MHRTVIAIVCALSLTLFGGQAMAQTTVVSDTFTGTDGTPLAAHVPNTAPSGSVWTIGGSPGVEVRYNSAMASGTSGAAVLGIIESGAADGTVAVDWIPQGYESPYGPYAGVVFRASDATSFFVATYWYGTIALSKLSPSLGYQTIASVSSSAPTGTVHIEIRLNGPNIELWWGGSRLIQATDTFNQNATKHGMRWVNAYDYTSRMDNFVVQTSGPPAATRVDVSPSGGVLLQGASRALSAVAYSSTNVSLPGTAFTWSSANPSIATVNASGVVTAVSPGTAVVSATAPNGVAGTATIVSVSNRTLVYDTFSGSTATTIAARAPDVGPGGQSWQADGPVASVAGGRLIPSTDTSSFLSTAMINTGNSDGTISVDWTPAAAASTLYGYPISGLVVRGVDPNNYLAVGYGIWGSNALALARFVNGQWTLIASADPGPVGVTTHHWEVRLAGANIQVLWDGVSRISVSEPTFQTATRHGFRWWTAYDHVSAFDNYSFETPPPPARVVITPAPISMRLFTAGSLTAQAYDSADHLLSGRVASWTTGNSTVASVAANGAMSATARGAGIGSSTITATIAGVSASAPVTVTQGAVVIADSFSGADGTLIQNRTPDFTLFGRRWAMSGPAGVLRGGGAAPWGADTTSFESVALIDALVSEGTVSADFAPAASSATAYGYPIGGLVFRAVDASNYFVAGFGVGGSTGVALGRFQNGNWTQLASVDAGSIVGRIPRLAVNLAGLTITVSVDGVPVITTTDATFQSATKYGFRWWPAYDWTSTFDNFVVEAPNANPVDHVIITPALPQVIIGGTNTLTAHAYTAANVEVPNVLFAWSSSDPLVVSTTIVGPNTGRVTGHQMASATITATPLSGAAGSATVQVIPAPPMRLTPTAITMGIGGRRVLFASVLDASNVKIPGVTFEWGSSDPSIAPVNASTTDGIGVVDALSSGTATITATAILAGGARAPIATTVTVNATNTLTEDPFSAAIGTPLGPAWTVEGPGSVVQAAGRAVIMPAPGGSPDWMFATVDNGGADITLSVDWNAASGTGPIWGGVVLRYTDSNNFILAQYYNWNVYVYAKIAGNFVPLGSAFVGNAAGRTHSFQVVTRGQAIDFWWDGSHRISASSPHNQLATRHGLTWVPSNDASSTFSNFKIVDGMHVIESAPPSGCFNGLFPSGRSFGAAGGSDTIVISAPDGCGWTASTDASWITLSSTTGAGSAYFDYSVAPFTGASRSAIISIGGAVFSVTQNGDGNPGGGGTWPSTLTAGQTLSTLKSPDGRFQFTYRSDGNIVLSQGSTVLWSSGTSGAGTPIMQGDGNFVLYFSDGRAPWHTNTVGHPGATLVVENGGVVVILDAEGQALWSTPPEGAACIGGDPAVLNVPADGGTGSVQVLLPPGCQWVVQSNQDWTSLQDTSGTGPATVTLVVLPNDSDAPRVAQITSGQQTLAFVHEDFRRPPANWPPALHLAPTQRGTVPGKPFLDSCLHMDQWPQVLSKTMYLGNAEWVFNPQVVPASVISDADLMTCFANMSAHGLKLMVESPIFKQQCRGVGCFAQSQPIYERIIGLGGHLDAISMDSAYGDSKNQPVPGGPLTFATAINETADWIKLVREHYPSTQIIEIEQLNNGLPAAALYQWMNALRSRCQQIGTRPPDTFEIDLNWTDDEGRRMDNIFWLQQTANALGMKFGVVFWAVKPDADWAFTAHDWYVGLMEQGRRFWTGYPMMLDLYSINDWRQAPDIAVPEQTEQLTFMRSVLDFVSSYLFPVAVPRY